MITFVYLYLGLPECQDTNLRSMTGEGIPGEGPGLADEIGFDAMPDAAGGEGVTGWLNRKG